MSSLAPRGSRAAASLCHRRRMEVEFCERKEGLGVQCGYGGGERKGNFGGLKKKRVYGFLVLGRKEKRSADLNAPFLIF